MARLTASVGEGGRNAAPDVKYLQALLVDWQLVRALPALRIDGVCGPLTKAAIVAFQRAHTNMVDGRADPAGATVTKLEALHLENLVGPLLGLALTAETSPMPRSPMPSDASVHAERYLSGLRATFGS